MASRRMFSVDVVCTDKFLEMPSSSQALYFQFGMNADDEGFVSAPKQITRMANASDDDLRILVSKGYVIPFDSGIIVMKHWNMNNQLRKDRIKKTAHKEEKELLMVDNGKYIERSQYILSDANQMPTNCQPSDNQMSVKLATQYSIDKYSIDKDNKYSVCFESFWKEYPRKKEKAKAYKAYKARIKDGFSEVDLLTATRRYAEECRQKGTEERYIKLGATFLSANTPFIDYLENEKENEDEANNQDRRKTADLYRDMLN